MAEFLFILSMTIFIVSIFIVLNPYLVRLKVFVRSLYENKEHIEKNKN